VVEIWEGKWVKGNNSAILGFWALISNWDFFCIILTGKNRLI
jgi:hypothetical protein